MRCVVRRCPIPVSSKLVRDKLTRMKGTVPVMVSVSQRIIVDYTEPLQIESTRNHRFIRFGKYARLISGPISGTPDTNTHSLLVIGDTSGPPPPVTSTPRVEPCTAGDTSLVFTGTLTASKWYFLYDANRKETHRTATIDPVREIGGELVYVTSVVLDEAALRHPLTQSYGGTGTDVVLVDVNDRVCENISIRGGTFIGKRQAGMRAQIDCGMVAGLRIQGCKFDTGWVAAVAIYCCRDSSISQCTADRFSGLHQFGTGYTFLIDRSANTSTHGLMTRDTRYGVSVARGSANWLVNGVLGEQCRDGAIDIHGGDCYNGEFNNIIASGTIDGTKATTRLGNSDWRRGADQVTLQNSSCHTLFLDSAIRNSTIDNVSCTLCTIQGAGQDPNVGSPLGKFDNVEFSNCTFTANETDTGPAVNLIAGPEPAPQYLWFQDLKFTSCTATMQWSVYQPAIACQATSGGSTIFLTGCTVVNTSAVTTDSGKLMYLGAPKAAYLSGTGDPIEMTWESTTALLPNRAPLFPVIGAASTDSGMSAVTFFDNTAGATPNRRGPTLSSLSSISEDDFKNISYETI